MALFDIHLSGTSRSSTAGSTSGSISDSVNQLEPQDGVMAADSMENVNVMNRDVSWEEFDAEFVSYIIIPRLKWYKPDVTIASQRAILLALDFSHIAWFSYTFLLDLGLNFRYFEWHNLTEIVQE